MIDDKSKKERVNNMAKFILRILMLLNVIVILIGLWGFTMDALQGIIFVIGGFVSLILVATILDLITSTDSLKSSIYYHRKELDDLRRLINDRSE